MLIYDNRERIRILLQLEGSVLWRTTPLGVMVGAVTFGFVWWIRYDDDSFWKPSITDTWAANVAGTAISFAIVYRTSMAWARYWEAASQVQFMFSKWSDSFSQLMSFISTAEKRTAGLDDPASKQRRKDLRKARERLAHDFTLISALGTHRLTHGDLSRMRRRAEKYSARAPWTNWFCCAVRLIRYWNQLIVNKQDLRYNDVTNAFRLPLFKVIEFESQNTRVRARVQKNTRGPLLCLLRNTCDNRSVDLETLEASENQSQWSNMSGRSSVVLTATNVTWSSDLVIMGEMTPEERVELDSGYDPEDMSCSQPDRVSRLVGWISEDINELVPVTETPPPIMSRCYQELSNGMLGFNQAKKMSDIPFPFPFSQLLEMLLVFFTCLIPVYASYFTGGLISSPLLAMIVSMAFWSLSEISRELETPFADGPNQLPVIDMHERFVEVVQHLYITRRPVKRPVTSSEDQSPQNDEEQFFIGPAPVVQDNAREADLPKKDRI